MEGDEQLVFFAPGEWSPRFGPDFFTASVGQAEDDDGTHRVMFFPVRVRRGGGEASRSEWEVRHRYSAFAALRQELGAARPGLAAKGKAPFPGKGWWWQHGDAGFLEHRRAALEAWLYDQLKKRDVVGMACTRAFLGFP